LEALPIIVRDVRVLKRWSDERRDRLHRREGEDATGEGAEPRILRSHNSLTSCLPNVYANKEPPPWLTATGAGRQGSPRLRFWLHLRRGETPYAPKLLRSLNLSSIAEIPHLAGTHVKDFGCCLYVNPFLIGHRSCMGLLDIERKTYSPRSIARSTAFLRVLHSVRARI